MEYLVINLSINNQGGTTMKSYTDISQSKKLAEILPLESADMHYSTWTIVSEDGEFIVSVSQQGETIEELQKEYGNQIIPCWSLAALLDVLPNTIGNYNKVLYWETDWYCAYEDESGIYLEEQTSDAAIDACYEMIIKLHEQNLL